MIKERLTMITSWNNQMLKNHTKYESGAMNQQKPQKEELFDKDDNDYDDDDDDPTMK
jgi:hypothetical protein